MGPVTKLTCEIDQGDRSCLPSRFVEVTVDPEFGGDAGGVDVYISGMECAIRCRIVYVNGTPELRVSTFHHDDGPPGACHSELRFVLPLDAKKGAIHEEA